MKAVGVTGPDYMPRLFDIDEPVASPGGVVVEVLAASVNDFDRAAVEGRYIALTGQLDPVLLGRDFVGRVAAVGDDVDYIDVGMYVAGTMAPQGGQAHSPTWWRFRRNCLPRSPTALTSPKPPAWAWRGSLRSTRSARSEPQISEPPLSTVPLARSADSPSSWRRPAVPSSLQSPRLRRRISRGSSAPTSSFPRAQTRHRQFRRCGTFSAAASTPPSTSPVTFPSLPAWCARVGSSPRSPTPQRGLSAQTPIRSDDRRPERAQAGRSPLQGRRAPATQPCRPHSFFRPGRRRRQSG